MPSPLPPQAKHDHGLLKFPEGFLWGTSTSAYQVEGNNKNSDWWQWEKKHQPQSKHSGLACDHYNKYEQDFQLAQDLGHNSHRLSLEWSRIEPKAGEFDQNEIDHYINVLKSLKDKNFTVMLTLWHFTLPQWVADIGGWGNKKTIKYFLRFVEKIVPILEPNVDLWVTLNEPSVYVYMGYISALWPPQKKSHWKAFVATRNLATAHNQSYKLIHKLIPDAQVGIAHNVQSFEAYHKHSLPELLGVYLGDMFSNHLFYFLTKKHHDFLGMNYYFHHRLKKLDNLIPEIVNVQNQYRDVSDLGYEVYPEGLFEVLADLSNHLPIYITECGIASTNDDRRTRFLINYLQEVYRAIDSNVPVKGFFYWSLLDNFEWHEGFEPRFGLVEINYSNQKRKVRYSAYVYKEIIKHNAIPHKLLKLLGHTVQVDEVLCSLHDDGPKVLCQHQKD